MSCFKPRGEGRVVKPADAVFGLLTVQLWTDSHDGKVQVTAQLEPPPGPPPTGLHTTEAAAKRAALAYLRELELDVRQAITTLEAEVQP